MTGTAQSFRPAFPLVEAKLRPPTRRPTAIDRPRLIRMLLDVGGPRFVALLAPPGYGKTTLLAQWAERETRPVAWLTIDDLDNDPSVMLTYLATAFDRIMPIDDSIQAALAAPRERILATAVPRLATALDRSGLPAVLMVDDVHRLVDRTSLDALTALLDHLPPMFRVAFAGRTEPDIPLARYRAAGDLLDIDTAHLALSQEEARGVADAEGYPLSPGDVTTLTERTEGWVTGVHLAAQAMARGAQDSGWLATVSGRDRQIAAYLRSEFERFLAEDDVTVLTRTSILETVTAPVAQALTGVADAAERLGVLARRSLLIQQIGAAGTTYRYHLLLRDFLQAELDHRAPGVRPDLHRRAAAWYAAERDLDQAVEHAMSSGDADLTTRLVTAASLPTFYGGRPGTVDRWMRSLDPSLFERHPPLAVIAGWIDLLNGRPDAADRMADIADRSTFAGPPGDGSASFESQRAMLRAIMARRGPAVVLADAQLAASMERAGSPWRANALWLLGSAWLILGDQDAADLSFEESIEAGSTAGGTAMVARAKRAAIALTRGDWAAAEALLEQARTLLVTSHFEEILPALIVHAVSARLNVHRGNFARARDDLVRAQLIRPLASHAAPWFAVDVLLEIARSYLGMSDPAGARVALREAEQIVRRRPALGVLTTALMAMRRQLEDAANTLAGSSTLTTTELRVLALLPTYLSFQDIAQRLAVSRNTTKSHAMSIYGKLQASSRAEAVERAVELGLLEPFPGLEPARSPSAG